jgi:hypothetical protein
VAEIEEDDGGTYQHRKALARWVDEWQELPFYRRAPGGAKWLSGGLAHGCMESTTAGVGQHLSGQVCWDS